MAADDPALDSEATRAALELLVEAVAREIKPGVFETKLAASTLRDLLEEPSPRSYSLAVRAFNAIDRDTRRRIQDNAQSAAMVYRTRGGETVSVVEPRPSPRQRTGAHQASGFLQALNFGGGRAPEPPHPNKK